jgi:Flp pilus assembly protein TadG
MRQCFHSTAGTFAKNTRSSIAVEYALIVPILILLALGAVEFSVAIRAKLDVDRIARTVSALIQTQTSVSPAQLQDYYIAGQDIYNGNIGTLSISAASVTYTNYVNFKRQATTTAVGWDASTAGTTPAYTAFTNAAAYAPAANLSDGIQNDSVIVVQASAQYSLPFLPNFFSSIPMGLSFSSVSIARPRNILVVTKNGW